MKAVIVSGFHRLESETLSLLRDQFPRWPWPGPSWSLWTLTFFWVQPVGPLRTIAKGKVQNGMTTYKKHQICIVPP